MNDITFYYKASLHLITIVNVTIYAKFPTIIYDKKDREYISRPFSFNYHQEITPNPPNVSNAAHTPP